MRGPVVGSLTCHSCGTGVVVRGPASKLYLVCYMFITQMVIKSYDYAIST